MLFLHHNKGTQAKPVFLLQTSLLDRGIWILRRCKDFFLSPWPCIHNHRALSYAASYPSFFTRDTTPPYLHTSLLTYFGSPITPISLLSDAIHHRSGFSPRPPHPTYLGTYVLLLSPLVSPLPIMSVPPSFAFFRRNHTFFIHTNVQRIQHKYVCECLLNVDCKINIYISENRTYKK